MLGFTSIYFLRLMLPSTRTLECMYCKPIPWLRSFKFFRFFHEILPVANFHSQAINATHRKIINAHQKNVSSETIPLINIATKNITNNSNMFNSLLNLLLQQAGDCVSERFYVHYLGGGEKVADLSEPIVRSMCL